MDYTKEPVRACAKATQLNPTNTKKLSRAELDRRAKRMCVALYEAYMYETGLSPFDGKSATLVSNLMSLDLDHIDKRSTNPERIYCIENWQLITRAENTDKPNHKDSRTEHFKIWIEKLNCFK